MDVSVLDAVLDAVLIIAAIAQLVLVGGRALELLQTLRRARHVVVLRSGRCGVYGSADAGG